MHGETFAAISEELWQEINAQRLHKVGLFFFDNDKKVVGLYLNYRKV